MKYVVICFSLLLVLLAGCTTMPDELKSIGTPVVQTFEVTPSVINAHETSSLRWNTINAQSAHIDNGVGDVATNGTLTVQPESTMFYTLTAKNAIGVTTARTQIIVRTGQTSQWTLPSSVPRVNTFVADRTSILTGEYAVLRWNALDTTQVMLTPVGVVDTSGEIRVYPIETTTYVLTATNQAGDTKANLTVTVVSPSPQDSMKEKTVVLNALADESGSLIKGTQYLDYVKQDSASAGDTSLNQASRAFLSFDISSIPADAVINEAILDLSKYVKTGDPTYAKSAWGNMGALEVYHLQYGTYDDLGLTAYNKVTKLTQGGAFNNYPLSLWAWDVKNANDGSTVIQNLIQTDAKRCQFRIQFFTSTNWDGVSDMFHFDNATLTIKYSLPD
jgi:hypothetical protein